MSRPRVTFLCHYFHPDDVASARHVSDLCEDLAAHGWDVEVRPSNRGCRDESDAYPPREDWRGVAIRRVSRPAFRQASSAGRTLNAAWMIARWSTIVARRSTVRSDVIVVGTDPVLSVLVATVVKRFRPEVRVAHWCFDMYPEAAIADGMLHEGSLAVRLIRRALRSAYASCDLVADLGECMRGRLAVYAHGARSVTLVPWAVVEPQVVSDGDSVTRAELFGDASLGLLYSGNFGRAHSCDTILELARALRDDGARFCFAVRGNRVNELHAAVRPSDVNVSFASFAPESHLESRLAAADVHLASLRDEWTGAVVPSKFFGSLASGRPVVFAGSHSSALARWIHEHEVGWVLNHESVPDVARSLRQLGSSRSELVALQKRCHAVYQKHFARARVTTAWDRELRALLGARHTCSEHPEGTHTGLGREDAQARGA